MLDAAVLVPVLRSPRGDLRVVVVRRTDGGLHGGELAFPGGKREPGDGSLLDTALREAREEVGLEAAAVEVLGDLPVVHTRGTGFRIAPFLARVVRPPVWHGDTREVAEVIEVSLDDLRGAEVGDHARDADEPHYRVGRYRLWGATYRILRPVVPRLLAGEWSI